MDYLIEENGRNTHYFLKEGFGLFKKQIREIKECVLDGNVTAFGLWGDGKITHIIAEKNGELLYILSENGNNRKFIIQNLPDGVKILKIFIYPIENRLNMLYTAEISGNTYLMHQILSGGEKPKELLKTNSSDFLVRGKRVYLTNLNGDSGFFELSSENPTYFIKTSKNTGCPYILGTHTAFISDGKIFFDNRELAKDENAKNIIIMEYSGDIFLLWRSGDFIKYISASVPQDSPHTIISPDRFPILFALWINDECYHFYGSYLANGFTTYINQSPFSYLPEKASDSFLLKKMESMRLEINKLRDQLSKLQ
ncbi:MAG: hypothetical protein Q4B31_04520 [Clostridia bacterium]|nr:hypothetical protein [Clostridia bacterium]